MQGDLWRKTKWRVYLLVCDFSSFHPSNSRNTVKSDGVRSCLIELQSFLLIKIDVDPIHSVLKFLPRCLKLFVFFVQMLQWIVSFSCNMVFMKIWYRFSHTQSCRFTGFRNTRKFWFDFIGFTIPTIFHNFSRQSRSHWRFQLLTRILDGFFEFRSLRVNEINPSQLSCVFQMELLIRPLLLLLQVRMLSHWLP